MRLERPGLTPGFWVGALNMFFFMAALILCLMVGFL